jgi:DNA-binding NarL/FixJ family response regulator
MHSSSYSPNRNRLRMILADGSDIMRAGIKRMFSEVHEIEIIEERTDARSTIAAIRDLRPDLVMLDFYLNKGTAVEVLQAARSVRPRPLCVVHTEYAEPGIRAICYAAGADVFYDDSRDIAPLLTMMRKLACALLNPALAIA